MTKKFILQEDIEIITVHGVLKVKDLYDAYVQNNNYFESSFEIAGAYAGQEYRTCIKTMQEIYCNESYELLLMGAMTDTRTIIVHPKQTVINSEGNNIYIKDTKAYEKILSLNGMLLIKSVGQLTVPQRFFIIEVNNPVMPSLYATNLVLNPMKEEDVEKENPFFIEEL